MSPTESPGLVSTSLRLGVKKLFAVLEAYPALKANEQFLVLQKELSLTEDRFAAARRFYNGNVRDLSVLRDSFSSSLIGGLFNFERGSCFELPSDAERVVPRVDVSL
jgi:LemA protein